MNRLAQSLSRVPIKYETMSFVSASKAVHVQVSPAPAIGFFIATTFFCLAAVKLQISSTWMRSAFTPRTFSSWKAAQISPASSRSFETVLIDTSYTREIDRMDDPSQSMERIWIRVAIGSLSIGHCIAYEIQNSKHYFQL